MSVIITAACVLHNVCLLADEGDIEHLLADEGDIENSEKHLFLDNDDDDDDNDHPQVPVAQAIAKRNLIVNYLN